MRKAWGHRDAFSIEIERRRGTRKSQAGGEFDMPKVRPQRAMSHPLSLFLSHSSPDKPFVRWLAEFSELSRCPCLGRRIGD